MKISHFFYAIFLSLLSSTVFAASLLEHVESESGVKLPGYTGVITTPFAGIAAFANGDGVEHATSKLSNAPGIFRIDVRGASSSASVAGISLYIGASKIGAVSFNGTSATAQSLTFQLNSVPVTSKIRFVLETDSGANDTFLDWYELHYVGPIPPPPAAPVLPTKGAYQSGVYRNLFVEAGYSAIDVNAKVIAAYNQLFHSALTDRDTGEAFFIADPTDASRAYIWDTGNNDVRSEGMSYGMMFAVQMNRQDDFNKLWAWANKYSLNTSGDMKGYFGWQKNVDGTNRDVNPAPDGEEYFVTALFFASHRWGDGTGIYNYKAEANKLLDNMYSNGQTHYVNGQLVSFSLFDKTANQILFSPYGAQFTDPSYHLPAFYELWSRWATNNKAYWAQLAVNSRAFWKKAIVASNGLNPDYANFDGSVVTSEAMDHQVFGYDAWRTLGNAAIDYSWWLADPWQTTYAKTAHAFFKSKGSNYTSRYSLNGEAYGALGHSPGLVGINAIGALASDSSDAWFFIKDLWDTPVPTGKYRYYDGNLYLFGLLAASGNYKIYCPNNTCAGTSSSSSAQSSSALSSISSSSSSSRASSVSSSSSRSSTSSSIASTSSSSVGGGLLCEHLIANQWDQGFTANIRLTNKTTSPISNWNISWRYQDGSLMTNGWNANFSGANPYSATPLSWMVTINPGQTMEIGVQGKKGSFAAPAPTVKVTGNFCQQ